MRDQRSTCIQLLMALTFYLASPALGQMQVETSPVPKAKSPPTHVKPTADGEYFMLSRVMRTRLAPGDPFELALHWAAKGKDGKPAHLVTQHSPYGHVVDRKATLESYTVAISTPDGKQHSLRLRWPAEQDQFRPVEYLDSDVLRFYRIDKVGLTLRSGIVLRWVDANVPRFDQRGLYKLEIGGVIHHGPAKGPGLELDHVAKTPFTTGVHRFKVDPRAKSFDQLTRIAQAAIIKRDSGAKPRPAPLGAKRYGVIENTGGDFVVFLANTPRPALWQYDLHTVTLTPTGDVKNHSTTKIFTCVAAGTLIATASGPIPVENLRIADRVWGYDLKLKSRVLTRVRAIRVGSAQRTLRIGDDLRVTAAHPILTNTGWKHARDIGADNTLLNSMGRWVSVRVEPMDEPVVVYDLTVDEPHNFFAGGILVHNKSRAWTPTLDDPWYFLFIQN